MKKSCLISLAALLLPAAAHAFQPQVLDQEQTAYDGGMSAPSLTGYYVGQVFTAGLTGTLTEIDMGFFNNISGSGQLQIFAGAGIGGTDMETESRSVVSTVSNGYTWNDWAVDVPVTSGSQYTFVFTPDTANIPNPYGVAIAYLSTYSGGYQIQGAPDTAASRTGFQSVFRTYVVAGAYVPIAPPAAGTSYRGLVTTGTSAGLISGGLNVRVGADGNFSAALSLEGRAYAFVGKFNQIGQYSGSINRGTIGVTLGYDGSPLLTGTLTDGARTFVYSGGVVGDTSDAGYLYRFTIAPGQLLGYAIAPQGTGYGDMSVNASGVVILTGKLPNGAPFAASSLITSGSTVPLYKPIGPGANSGIEGTLVFQDIPNASDCAGTLYWAQPPSNQYPAGFELATQFAAASYNPVIGGLSGDTVSFEASGSTLLQPLVAKIPLKLDGSLAAGSADHVQLFINPHTNGFYGKFQDPVTRAIYLFNGVLLPKARSGAGLFITSGLSGTVTIQY